MNTETPQESSIDLVSAALVVAQGAIKPAEFDATNPFFKSKYATLGSVISASREALFNSGLAILQTPTIQADIVSVHTRIVHKSGQSLDCGTMSLPLGDSDRNSDAQLAGSILTYLKRYAWASILGIYADTDDDGNSGPKGAIPRQQPPGRAASAKPPSDTTQGAKTPPAPQGDPGEPLLATPQQRMKALNGLKAAPGQEHRVPFTHYLESKKWINYDQLAEDWPLEHVPTTQNQFIALAGEFDQFLRDMAAEASK